jgi:hypothetical protein
MPDAIPLTTWQKAQAIYAQAEVDWNTAGRPCALHQAVDDYFGSVDAYLAWVAERKQEQV